MGFLKHMEWVFDGEHSYFHLKTNSTTLDVLLQKKNFSLNNQKLDYHALCIFKLWHILDYDVVVLSYTTNRLIGVTKVKKSTYISNKFFFCVVLGINKIFYASFFPLDEMRIKKIRWVASKKKFANIVAIAKVWTNW